MLKQNRSIWNISQVISDSFLEDFTMLNKNDILENKICESGIVVVETKIPYSRSFRLSIDNSMIFFK